MPPPMQLAHGSLRAADATAVRPEACLTAGGAGTIFRGALLNAEAIQRNGSEVCAVKEVMDWPSLTDEDNAKRFRQEVAPTWSSC